MTRQISPVDQRRLPPAELTVLRARLHEERVFRRQQLQDIADGIEAGCTPEVQAHREVRHKLAAAARRSLAETEAALARMATGRYGRCGRCGDLIAVDRLRAHPQVRHCARCQLFLEMQR